MLISVMFRGYKKSEPVWQVSLLMIELRSGRSRPAGHAASARDDDAFVCLFLQEWDRTVRIEIEGHFENDQVVEARLSCEGTPRLYMSAPSPAASVEPVGDKSKRVGFIRATTRRRAIYTGQQGDRYAAAATDRFRPFRTFGFRQVVS